MTYRCDRCKREFEGDVYGQYVQMGYSTMMDKDPGLADRIKFICGDFYTIESPLWGERIMVYLCGECKVELTNVLDLYFAPMMEKADA